MRGREGKKMKKKKTSSKSNAIRIYFTGSSDLPLYIYHMKQNKWANIPVPMMIIMLGRKRSNTTHGNTYFCARGTIGSAILLNDQQQVKNSVDPKGRSGSL